MKARIDEAFVRAADEELRREGLDAWLLYDLEARNRIAAELLSLPEGLSRRWFVLLRPGQPPVALAHRIELSHWDEWPYELRHYAGWEEMEERLRGLLEGHGTVAMEVSSRDNVPFLDNVPAGMAELIESLGPELVSSAALLSRTYAQWGDEGRRLHDRAASVLSRVARRAFGLACEAVGRAAAPEVEPEDEGEAWGAAGAEPNTTGGSGVAARPPPADEHELAEWIRATLRDAGLVGGDAIVAIGPNSAKPHYFPSAEEAEALVPDQVLLIDLWGKVEGEPAAVFADQTWMGYLGPELPEEAVRAWWAVRDARNAAVERIRRGAATGELPTGAEVDLEARRVLETRGYGEAIQHRTGHAMDRVNHGFGPNLDSFETRDERRLVPGIGFSVEPGLYFEGRFGLRSEINVYMADDDPVVTTPDVQDAPWTTAA